MKVICTCHKRPLRALLLLVNHVNGFMKFAKLTEDILNWLTNILLGIVTIFMH
jgi:hypothetical protein